MAVDDLSFEVSARHHHRADRPERRRQDHGVQLHHRLLQAERGALGAAPRRRGGMERARCAHRQRRAQPRTRGRHAFPARTHAGLSGRPAGARRPHLPEHPPVSRHDGAGEPDGRPAQPADARLRLYAVRRARLSLLWHRRARRHRQGARLARSRRPHSARRRSGRRPALWRPAPPRNRARHVHRSGAALPRRAGRRPQSARERRTQRPAARHPRRLRHFSAADRARHVGGDGDFRRRRRARLRRQDRRGQAGAGAQRSESDRRLSRRRRRARRPRSKRRSGYDRRCSPCAA